jgi:DNA-binding response OmpR family regulator/nitrogen-specific signal transduction histidine kinase
LAGVIYGGSKTKDILRERHEQAFHVIASFCGLKLAQKDAEESIREAERTKAEVDRYKEMDELKNRFIANISHDLKTPLSLIKGPAKQISQISKEEKVRSLSNYIIANADHLLRVVHQLLELNRIEKGINELYLQRIDLKGVCDKIHVQYEERARAKSIALNFNAEDITMVTDAFRLEQVIHNLLSNALRYTDEGGKISINVIKEGENIKCCITDTGVGIPIELQQKVFERFFKINENNQEGTGIGLSLVKEYVQLLEGSIHLDSTEGKGSTFTLYFPLVHSAYESVEKEEDLKLEIDFPSNGKPHMLIVEDHADLNNFVSSYFENDFVTSSAFDGDEALLSIRKVLPDIIITDLMMPKRDGKSLVDEIRSNDEWAHIPIIVLSAKSGTNNKVDLYNLGVDNFVAKPFDIEELDVIVKSTLSKRKQLRDLFRTKFLNKTVETDQHQSPPKEFSATDINGSFPLEKLKNYLSEHLDRGELSIHELASHLGLGRNRFQKELKEITGLTPVEFVRSYRLNEAQNMLKDRSKNISEVAYAVGFSNLSYFTRSFKQEFGMLPSEVNN